MADIKPDPIVLRKRIEVRSDEMKLNLNRSELRRMELQHETDILLANEEATRLEIVKLTKELESLPKEKHNG